MSYMEERQVKISLTEKLPKIQKQEAVNKQRSKNLQKRWGAADKQDKQERLELVKTPEEGWGAPTGKSRGDNCTNNYRKRKKNTIRQADTFKIKDGGTETQYNSRKQQGAAWLCQDRKTHQRLARNL